MRTFVSALPVAAVAALVALTACSDPDCLENEDKIGATCYPKPKTGDASVETVVPDGGSKPVSSGLDAGPGDAASALPPDASQAPESDAQSDANPDAAPAQPVDPCPGGTLNECKGCEVLEHKVGEKCSNGGVGPCDLPGTYQCFGTSSVVCSAPPPTPSIEDCDGVDDDCDGMVDDGVTNACGGCGPVPAEICGDGIDNNCDGKTDEGLLNACGTCGPTPVEVCDSVDNDCDGAVDEDASDIKTWYPDCDGDGYAIATGAVKSCVAPVANANCKAYVQLAAMSQEDVDCRDDSTLYNPGVKTGYTTPTPGTGLWANELKFDFNCDGKAEVSDSLYVYGRYLPWCSVCSASLTECAAGPKPATSFCGANSTTSKIYRWNDTTKTCASDVSNSSLLCL